VRRVALIASHPVQYQAPWFRRLAEDVDLTVFFCHRQTAADQARAGFDVPFDWDVPLLDGYRHVWLRNIATQPGVDRWSGCDTPGIGLEIARGRFDACIVSGWYLKSYVQAMRACRRLHVPVLVRGDSQLVTPRRLVTRLAKALPYRWLLQRIDGHLYVGQRNRDYLRHYGVPHDRLFFVPHFVDNDWFAAESAASREDGCAATMRSACGARPDTAVFLFAGKLVARKRATDFIDALGRVVAEGLNVRGLIVGSGPDERSLRQRASNFANHVAFTGFQNQSAMPACYGAADAIVLPSDGHETWGLVVNEAMATGLPAIVSDAAGCSVDLVEDGRTGFIFRMGDVDGLAGRMRTFAALTPAERGAYRPRVLERIARYSLAAAADGTLNALTSVCGDAATRPSIRDPQHA
jgi:glycosyltransferase involved in cell wall biosynthesis